MTTKAKILFTSAGIAVLLVVGTAIKFSRNDHLDPNGHDVTSSPLGGLFQRASAVSDLKRRMGELREAYPAIVRFAQAHQDDLPRTIAELRPYLANNLTNLEDKHWELPAVGKMNPLVNGSDANKVILLQEKGGFPEHPKIILYGDGHIEYRK
jgi:hypothetical protein